MLLAGTAAPSSLDEELMFVLGGDGFTYHVTCRLDGMEMGSLSLGTSVGGLYSVVGEREMKRGNGVD